jgi:hypothetical protein
MAVAVLAILGFPEKVVIEVAIVAGAGIAAALLYPLGQLVWAWLQAPMRLLTEDVMAVREGLETLGDQINAIQGQVAAIAPQPPLRPPVNLRLSLLNSIRLGEMLMKQGWITPKEHEAWATPVIGLLTEQADPDDAARFLKQQSLREQLTVLEQLVEEYE